MPRKGTMPKKHDAKMHDAKMHDARSMMQKHDAKIAQSACTAKPKLKLFPDGYRWRKASFPTTGITEPFGVKASLEPKCQQ